MSDAATKLRAAVIDCAVEGAGITNPVRRRAAFANAAVEPPARALVDKVATTAWKVSDEDVAAARAAGLTEDEIFELAIAAALGQATRQLAAALAAVDEAFAEDRS